MGTVTVRSDLLAALDEITDGNHARRDELINETLQHYLAERKFEAEAPEWHVPHVQKGLASLDRGEVRERSMSEIVAKADGE